MGVLKNKNENSTDEASKCIQVLSEYAKALEGQVNERYLQKISAIGVDPASIPTDQFSPECLPPVQVFKESRGVQPNGCGICDHSCGQTNRRKIRRKSTCATLTAEEWCFGEHLDYHLTGWDCLVGPLLRMQSWTSGIVLTYRECSIYLEATTRLHGKLACTRVKCSWISPTYVN